MTTIDMTKLEEFIGRFATDFGASLHAATVVVGDKLGLYKALARPGRPPASSWPPAPAATGDCWKSGSTPSS